jgi:putative oxidoreductase
MCAGFVLAVNALLLIRTPPASGTVENDKEQLMDNFAAGRTPALNNYLVLLGRIALALMFLLSGWNKIGGYAATVQYMDSAGVPGGLLPLVIAVEIAGGLAVLFGFLTRWAALGLAVYTLIAAALFHSHFADQNQMIHFMKNVTIAGGFLVLAAHGAGAFSIDGRTRT